MFNNDLKLTFRNIIKNKAFSVINLAGLAIGFACAMLIFLYVQHELSYDSFHENADRIYRVTRKYDYPSGYKHHFARCPETWINQLPDNFPEIQKLIRFQRNRVAHLKIGETKFNDYHTFKIDSDVFDVFSFNLKQGDPETALKQPYSVVLTESMADKYFGEKHVLGRKITFANGDTDETEDFLITGVMQDLPDNVHFKINFLKSFKNAEERTGWAYVYLLLKPGADAAELQNKFPRFMDGHLEPNASEHSFLVLQKVTDIHLYSNLARELEPNGNIQSVYIFTCVAIFIIVLACINFMNLATARSIDRSKEVGIRKVLGSSRRQLMGYFFCEAFVFSFTAFLMALVIVEFLMPYFNNLTGKNLTLNNPELIGFFFAITGITGLLSGSYPAMRLSSFRPILVLTGNRKHTLSDSYYSLPIRKILVVMQFTISIILIISALVAYQQQSYIQNKQLGLTKEQIIATPQIPSAVKNNYAMFKKELLTIPGVAGVSAAMEEPSRPIRDTGWIYAEGMQEGEDAIMIDILGVDANFAGFMEMKIMAGNHFLPTIARDVVTPYDEMGPTVEYIDQLPRTYILNESAVKAIGWKRPEDAIGKQFSWGNDFCQLARGPIVGVIKDFNYTSLKNEIRPMAMVYEPLFFSSILIKLDTQNFSQTLSQAENLWNDVFPSYPFQYSFLDDLFEQLYLTEQRQSKVIGIFATLAIFIAFMGMFGLAAYSAKQRTKEIGIRKVLGATLLQIVMLFSKDYLRYVIGAGFLAIPIAWYLVEKLLENFAYKTSLSVGIFLVPVCFAVLIALITVGFQAAKTAVVNPVESLRHE